MTKKGLLINLGLCCGSLLLCLSLMELVLCLRPHNIYPEGYFRKDGPTGLLTATPGYCGTRESEYGQITIRTNSLGFRGAEFDPGDDRRKRVVILGDSFVQAIQVSEEQTFGTLLSRSPAGVQVVQAGMCGWGQGDQLRWLQSNCQQLQPHLVIIAVYLGNDLTIDNMKREHLGSTGYQVSRHGHLLNRRGGRDNSPFSKFKQHTVYRSRALLFLGHLFYKSGYLLSHRLEQPASTFYPYSRQALYLYKKDDRIQESYLRVFGKLVRQIDRLGQENDFKLLVMFIPWVRTMDDQHFHAVLDHYGLSREEYGVDFAREQIGRQMEASQIPYLDLHDVFRTRPDPMLAYGVQDTHFSPTGHAWTAEALSRKVEETLGRCQRLTP